MCRYVNNIILLLFISTVSGLVGCKSTGLNENLGTRVSAQGTNITFEWSENHPFATDYARQNIVLVAEYIEVGSDGRVKPVRQLISRSDNSLVEIRKKVFTLPDMLVSIPEQANICLLLEMNRRPVPVRAAGAADTARFAYPNWQQRVSANTKSRILAGHMQQAEQNLATASQNIEKALSQHLLEIADFNQQLQTEQLESPITVSEAANCNAIHAKPESLQTPQDVIAPEQQRAVAAQICTHRTFNKSRYVSGTELVLLPAALMFNDEELQKLAAVLVKEQIDFFNRFYNLAIDYFAEYKDKRYIPELGHPSDAIPVSGYTAGLQQQALNAIKSAEPLSAEQANRVHSVFGNEMQEFSNCVIEAEVQLKTKHDAWQLRKTAIPERAQARSRFLAEKCQLLFSENLDRMQILKQQETQAEQQFTRLQQQMRDGASGSGLAEKVVTLNPLSCKL